MDVHFAHKDVESFISHLEAPTIAKVVRTLDLLETFGHKLGMPHSKVIGSNLFELRVRGKQEIRLLYTFHNTVAVVLYGFVKKSYRIPKKEITTAFMRKNALDHV